MLNPSTAAQDRLREASRCHTAIFIEIFRCTLPAHSRKHWAPSAEHIEDTNVNVAYCYTIGNSILSQKNNEVIQMLSLGTATPISAVAGQKIHGDPLRSEERRVGKECRSRWSPYH